MFTIKKFYNLIELKEDDLTEYDNFDEANNLDEKYSNFAIAIEIIPELDKPSKEICENIEKIKEWSNFCFYKNYVDDVVCCFEDEADLDNILEEIKLGESITS